MSTFGPGDVGASRRAKPEAARFTIDTEGDTVAHDRVFFRRTPIGYVCVALGPPAKFLRFAFDDEGEAPFFAACRRYAHALETGELMPTQIPGGPFSLAQFDDAPLRRLAIAAALLKSGYNDQEPRDDRGRWSPEDDASQNPLVPARMTLPAEEPALLENPSRAVTSFLSALAGGGRALFAALGLFFMRLGDSPVQDGTIDGHPEISFHWDAEEGRLRIFRTDENGTHLVFDGNADGFGIFRSADGKAVARRLENGVAIDPYALPGAEPRPATESDEPNLCPDPTKDRPGARPKDILYQQWVGFTINGVSLPAGMAYRLFNLQSGKWVYFDECRWSTGSMVESKGDYSWMLSLGPGKKPFDNIQAEFLEQAERQLEAAGPRAVEWHTSREDLAIYLRKLFADNGLHIIVIYNPPPRWIYE